MEKEKKKLLEKYFSKYLSNLIVSHNLQLLQKEKKCSYEKHWTELYKVQKVQFKFIELRGPFKFSSLDKNWIAAQLTNELFLTNKVSFREGRVDLLYKGKELQNYVCHEKEKGQFFLFSTRGHSSLSELTSFKLSSKKFNDELRGSSSSSSNELSLNRPLSSRKNWI